MWGELEAFAVMTQRPTSNVGPGGQDPQGIAIDRARADLGGKHLELARSATPADDRRADRSVPRDPNRRTGPSFVLITNLTQISN